MADALVEALSRIRAADACPAVIPNSDLGGGGVCCLPGRQREQQIPRAKIGRFGMTVSREKAAPTSPDHPMARSPDSPWLGRAWLDEIDSAYPNPQKHRHSYRMRAVCRSQSLGHAVPGELTADCS